MLLFLDPSSTIFVASVHVVQAGEEFVTLIAMEKFVFSLEKFEGLKQGCPNFFYHGPHSEEYTKVRASH